MGITTILVEEIYKMDIVYKYKLKVTNFFNLSKSSYLIPNVPYSIKKFKQRPCPIGWIKKFGQHCSKLKTQWEWIQAQDIKKFICGCFFAMDLAYLCTKNKWPFS